MSQSITKFCTKCQRDRDLDDFGFLSASPDGRSRTCRECRKPICARSRERHASQNRYKQANRYEEARALLMALKSNPCTDCEQEFPWFVMEYDHRDPSTKIRSVSQWLGSGNITAMLAEIDRCDLVCANCHRIRTMIQVEDGILKMGRPRKYA